MNPIYVYRASLLRVIDGDTFVAIVDLGFFASIAIHVRLAGVDTPELHSSDPVQRAAALTARDFTAECLRDGFVLQSHHSERSFERWVCDVWLPNGQSLADAIVAAGHGIFVTH